MVLNHFGFPSNIINLIMSCISSTSTAILFNSNKLDSFQPSRGIRQGDPISPYIFLLCIEFMGAQISSMCENNRWDKIKASKNSPSFSHVSFANNLMLFAKVNAKNCEVIVEVLDTFCKLARQKMNLAKSRVLFSSNVSRRCKRSICRKLGINATQNLGRYLGFPLIYKGRSGDAFNFVIDKVQKKLSGWKTKFLSKVGKMVLAKSATIPVAKYYMQCQALPIKVCEAIDKLLRDFLWGSTAENRRNAHGKLEHCYSP